MSTAISQFPLTGRIGRSRALRRLLIDLENDPSLSRDDELAGRLTALDQLDAIMGDLDLEGFAAGGDLQIVADARALRSKFEAANERLYDSARYEIAFHSNPRAFHRWLLESTGDADVPNPRPGLGFDSRDEIVGGILQLRAPKDIDLPQSTEMVAYQPTPARHILELIAAVELSDEDLLVDLGSGLGHVPLLVSILTGKRTLGVELQPALVASALEAAENLNLSRVRFVAEDAREADLSDGTIFYLFSPFTGSILRDVLHRLHTQSAARPIRICSLGPCTRILQSLAWLKASTYVDTERITVFETP